MRKCIIIDTEMVWDEKAVEIHKEFKPGVLIALHHITAFLEYEIILLHDGSVPSVKKTDQLRSFLYGQDIPVAHLLRADGLKDALALYADGLYDLQASFLIGKNERVRNELAQAGLSILPEKVSSRFDWHDAFNLLKPLSRKVQYERKTGETDIFIEINLDGRGSSEIETGLGFFDHMLDQIARHSGMDLTISVKGDLHVDEHHTVEDTGLVLGEALSRALGRKTGIERYGFFLPMDETVCRVAIDFSGRPQLVWKVNFEREKVGDVPTELFEHFFKSLSDTARCNLFIEAEGTNEHHKIEAVFKAFARALRTAVKKDYHNSDVPSTKGAL